MSARGKLHQSLEVKPIPPSSHRSLRKQADDGTRELKSKYVSDLEQRNNRLKLEILKIRELLAEQAEREGKKDEHKLVPWEQSAGVIKKELENAYKQIHNYEREVTKLEDRQSGGLVAEKLARLETIVKEKDAHLEKLKAELTVVEKESFEYGRKLKNNYSKQEIEEQLLKLQQELRFLRERVREAEAKEKKKQENAKKQYDYIKRIEKELIEGGVSIDELEELKRNNIYSTILEKASDNTSMHAQSVRNQKKTIEQGEEQVTLSRYHDVRNEIKIKRKLQSDYEKKLQLLLKGKEEEEKKTVDTRMKLIERENEIQELDEQIKSLKKKVKKSNMKPGINSILVESGAAGQSKPPLPPNKIKVSVPNGSVKKDPLENHGHLKYDQKGIATEKGKRFSDRSILGRNFQTKITAVKLWTQKTQFGLCGIQCTYMYGDTVKVGGEHVVKKEGRDQYTENLYELQDGDYLKSVSGALSEGNQVEYLVLISAKLKIARFGVINPSLKQFNFDIEQNEMPVCLYGSLLPKVSEPGKPDVSCIELLGFEITQDNNPRPQIVDSV